MPFDQFFTSKAKVKRSKRSWKQRTHAPIESIVKTKTHEANHGYGKPRKIWDSPLMPRAE